MINGHGDDIHNYKDIKINFSSNIYGGFSHEGLFAHLRESMHLIARYPEPSPLSLEERLATKLGIGCSNVMVTNGATEAIYMIARTFCDCEPIIPQPTFSEYADASHGNHGTQHITWLCIPNNPTGHVLPKHELLDSIASNPRSIFVIDASYAAYTRQEVITAAEAIAFPNVMMLYSMTKDYAIPGLRLGYVIANASLLDRIRCQRMPWSVNALAIEAGHYLLSHDADYRIPVDMLLAERQRMESALHSLGIDTCTSHSNMLLCCLPIGTASSLKEYLATHHGILIRDASNFNTLTPQHFRIAIQAAEHNDALICALRQWIK